MLPVFYSFRRCPYAIRARLALRAAAIKVELREVFLRDKPAAFLAASPNATVPCLIDGSTTLDESLDIMIWALRQNDPDGWLDMPCEGWAWIERCDGPFKSALDRTKYAVRYPDSDPQVARSQAAHFLSDLDRQLDEALFGRLTVADFALLPFVRQFAFVDKPWFDAQPWPRVHVWLQDFLDSTIFASVMQKYPLWQPESAQIEFP